MILDARSDALPSPVDCDLCVVGGGPAGLALAHELDDGRRSVVVLESGGLRYEERAQSLLSGDGGDTYPPLESTRLAALGGSVHVWAGWGRPLDPIDFEDWPIGREELDPHYARAHELLELGDFDYSTQRWEHTAGRLRPAVDSAEVDTVLFRKTDVDVPARFAAALRTSTTTRVVLHASATRIEFDPRRHRATGVQVSTEQGRKFEVRPRVLVLAAGGIENARLLLLSGDVHPLVGRHFTEHLFVEAGTFVADDPAAAALLLQHSAGDGAARRTARGGWSLREDVLRRERLMNAAVHLIAGYESGPVFADPHVRSMLRAWDMVRGRAVPYRLATRLLHAARAPHLVARAALHKLVSGGTRDPGRFRLRGLFECRSGVDDRVELTDEADALGRRKARVRWTLHDEALWSVRRTHALLDAALRRGGGGRLELPPDDDDAWRACIEPAFHHLGTTRMHDDPRRGVVNRDGQVHGIDNLFVAGGSLFPTGGYANPTLTILALTLRLAGHLTSREASRTAARKPPYPDPAASPR